MGGAGEVDQQRGKGMFGDNFHGVIVHDFDTVNIVEARPEAGLGGKALQGVFDVLRLHLATVHRRLVVELHAFAQIEHDGLVVRVLPALRQVGHDGEIVGVFLLMPIGESHQTVVDQAADILRVEGDVQVRIEIGGLALGHADDAPILGLFPRGRRLREGQRPASSRKIHQQADHDGSEDDYSRHAERTACTYHASPLK